MQSKRNENVMSAVEFLEEYIEYNQDGEPPTGNAVGTFVNLLQRNGKGCSFKTITTDNSIEWRSDHSNTITWWKTTLNCPLSGRTFVSSLIPCRSDKQNIFGKEFIDFITVDKSIYFKSKKMAQKSSILQALKFLQVDSDEDTNVPPTSDAIYELGSVDQCDELRSNQVEDDQPCNALSHDLLSRLKIDSFPTFINRLWVLGIKSHGLQIEFWTRPPLNKEEYLSQKSLSRQFPTLIFCRVNIFMPIKFSVTISPAVESRSVAFSKAVDLIENEMQALGIVPRNAGECDPRDLIALHKLYKEAKIMHFLTPPTFAIRDIFIHNGEGLCELYLYELQVGAECANIFTKPHVVQFGLLFSVHDDAFSSEEDIEVTFPLTNGRNRIGKVTLGNRRRISCTDTCLESIMKLNIILQDSATYGRSKSSKDSGPGAFDKYGEFIQRAKDSMRSTLSQRTYLLTPIRKDGTKQCTVDWSSIEKIICNQIQTFQEWKSACEHCNIERCKALVFQSTSNQLYIIDNKAQDHGLTSMSQFSEPTHNTFSSYYKERYEIDLAYPELPLISARTFHSMNKEIDSSISLEEIESKSPTYLIPELTMVMPLEFDLLIMYRMVTLFALPMERILELRGLVKRLHDMRDSRGTPLSQCHGIGHCGKEGKLLLTYLEEATSIGSFVAYERLEHLGDAVLGYFVSMNYFAYNANMQWDDEDMGQCKLRTVRNKVLKRAGLGCGIDRVIHESQSEKQWDTVFRGNTCIGIQQKRREVCYRYLSEVVESIIGAIFLNNSGIDDPLFQNCCERNTIAFLEELCLPLYEDDTREFITSATHWFKPDDACLHKGFSFDTHEDWSIQLKKLIGTFQSEVYIKDRLVAGTRKLLSIFTQLDPSYDLQLTDDMELMLACALFNHSFESDSEDSIGDNPPIMLARFRENLFFIGEAALQLAVVMECYKRYKNASAGDLHMLKICCTSDDTIAYITIKNGIDECLYDEESENIERLKMLVNASEMYGSNMPAKLSNDVFKERWNRRWWSNENIVDVSPRYLGLGGGCLAGERTKVGKLLTADLVYGFKSVIGSLVLSVGLNRTWRAVIPLFEEILIFSPEETRKFFPNNITKSYASGKNAESTLGVQKLQAVYGNGWSAVAL